MSIDLKQFYQVFFEEAAEHLQSMEALLLNLDQNDPDPEDLDAIFRAAHSIKGGSGTFGFSDMAALTHALETMLDRMRKFELRPSQEIVNLLLEGQDAIHAQLNAHRGDGACDPAQAEGVIERVEELLVAAKHHGTSAPEAVSVAPASAKREQRRFRLVLPALAQPAIVENLLRELAEVGQLHGLGAIGPDATPDQLDLTTSLSYDELVDLFGFVAGEGEFRVEEITASAPVAPVAEQADPGFGFFVDLASLAPQGAEAPADPGFGLFAEAPASALPPAADPGYGFFLPLPAEDAIADAAEVTAAHGRRTSDDPQTPVARAGRRDTDKVVAAPAEAESSSIRVSVDKVDQLINLVGELVITQAMLAQTSARADPVLYERLFGGLVQLERNTRELQEAVMYIRMMPIAFVFRRFPRVVHDLAQKLGKQVELKMVGESTELDKSMIEKIADPLTHLVRNSLDHGLESPERRRATGKPEKGTITLRAFHEGGSIVVEVIDDGGGLNREKILSKARERGMNVSDSLADAEVWLLIFEAGFSTADAVTDVSGRGVGMDVVRRNIQAVGGRVEITSRTGEGTTISIRLPLTLAILDGLSVAVGDEMFIIPLTFIIESLQPVDTEVSSIQGAARVLHVRGEYIPVLSMQERLGVPGPTKRFEEGICVIVEAEGRRAALFVDGLVAQHQVVIKSLESNYRKVPGVSGATIMGDGRVALILDVAGLVRVVPPSYARAA